MKKRKDIHFEVSERKVLLRIFDFFSVLFSLYFVGIIFQFDYFNISATNYYWTIVLGLYLLFFGSVFEMYNLQVASNQYQVIKSIILTTSITVGVWWIGFSHITYYYLPKEYFFANVRDGLCHFALC